MHIKKVPSFILFMVQIIQTLHEIDQLHFYSPISISVLRYISTLKLHFSAIHGTSSQIKLAEQNSELFVAHDICVFSQENVF